MRSSSLTTRPSTSGSSRPPRVRCGRPWPGAAVLDTARLARRVLGRDEVRDCKLSTLARHFRASTTPTHRALDDARATVDVLHGLIERVGTEGVQSFEELRDLLRAGVHRATAQAAPGRGPAARPGRVRLPGRGRPAALHRQVARPAVEGPVLLHGERDPHPDGRDGRAGRVRASHPVPDRARGGGARAPPDRRAQAALQPPVALPRASAVGQAHHRGLPPAVRRPRGARRRGHLPRALRRPAGG